MLPRPRVINVGMDRIIDRAELAGQLEEALAEVTAGGIVTITEAGNPLARIVPSKPEFASEAERLRIVEAGKRMLENMRRLEPKVVGPWTRDEMHEREPWPNGPPCP